MAKTFTMRVEKDEDGWLISDVDGLPGCHTQARTLEELRERTKEAILAYTGKSMTIHLVERSATH